MPPSVWKITCIGSSGFAAASGAPPHPANAIASAPQRTISDAAAGKNRLARPSNVAAGSRRTRSRRPPAGKCLICVISLKLASDRPRRSLPIRAPRVAYGYLVTLIPTSDQAWRTAFCSALPSPYSLPATSAVRLAKRRKPRVRPQPRVAQRLVPDLPGPLPGVAAERGGGQVEGVVGDAGVDVDAAVVLGRCGRSPSMCAGCGSLPSTGSS